MMSCSVAPETTGWHAPVSGIASFDQAARFSAVPDVAVLLRRGAEAPAVIEVRPGESGARPGEAVIRGEADVLCLCRAVGPRPFSFRAGGRSFAIRPELHLAAFFPAGTDRHVSGGSSDDAIVQVHFPRGWLARLAGDAGAIPREPRVWNADPGFADLMRLLAALRADPVPDPAALEHWAHLTALRALRLARTPAQRPHALAPFPLNAVRDFVEANLAREIHLAELAAVARLSLHHFARSFRRETGLPPGAWIERRRVVEVQRLLRDPDVTLEEVARRAGFAGPSALRAAFRRVIGSTAELARSASHGR